MKIRIGLLTILLLLLNPGAGADIRERPENWARPMLSEHLKNFYKLDDKVYRAAQPDDEGMRELAAFGIGEVLNLREYHDDKDEAEGTGLVLHRLKMGAGSIDDNDVIAALRIIKNAQKPLLIHCWHGSDRTGTISALYRRVFQQWTAEQALDELQNGGYGFHSLYQNIPEYIRHADVDKIRRAVFQE